jgi:hypothetical protein
VIDVAPGIDYTRIDMRPVEVSTVRVRGRVIGATAHPSVRTTIRLVPGTTLPGSQGEPTARAEADGTFDLIGVIPGAYDLIALANGSAGRGAGSAETDRAFAYLRLDVGESDIDNLTVQLTPGLTVRGRVHVEAAAGLPPLDPADVRVTLVADRIRYGVSASPASVAPDGSFRIDGLPPNDYRVELSGLEPAAYLKEARLGTDDVLDSGMRILNDPMGELSLLVAQDSGTVSASVVDALNAPVRGVRTVLVPELPRRDRLDLYRVATSENDGSVTFENVAPGTYTLFAWEEDVPSGAWANADFLRRDEDLGEPVRLDPRSSARATVRIVPAP